MKKANGPNCTTDIPEMLLYSNPDYWSTWKPKVSVCYQSPPRQDMTNPKRSRRNSVVVRVDSNQETGTRLIAAEKRSMADPCESRSVVSACRQESLVLIFYNGAVV